MARRKISFGKVDGYRIGRKTCRVDVEVELRDCGGGKTVFTASANLWNSKGTDLLRGGQCLDSLASEFPELAGNPLYMEILGLWKSYHLNNMHSGTPRQERALREAGIDSWASNYDLCCSYLEGIGLLEDPDLRGYRFGSGWLYWPIPDSDLNRIASIISGK